MGEMGVGDGNRVGADAADRRARNFARKRAGPGGAGHAMKPQPAHGKASTAHMSDAAVLSIRNASKTASFEVGKGRAVAVSTDARTNLDGGVKSPGRPTSPEPPPNGRTDLPSMVKGAAGCVLRLI